MPPEVRITLQRLNWVRHRDGGAVMVLPAHVPALCGCDGVITPWKGRAGQAILRQIYLSP
jgi:hypothetical protein